MLYSIFISALLINNVYSQVFLRQTKFELDGDTESTKGSDGKKIYQIDGFPVDWDYFNDYNKDVTSYPTLGFYGTGILVDPGTSTTFEQSAKDTKDISTWLYGPDNNAQAKTDIYNLASFARVINGQLLLHFMADRVGGSGITANSAFGYWFVQDPLFGINGVDGSYGTFSGTHFPGDLLITANFANPPYIELFKWQGSGTSGSLVSVSSSNQRCSSTSDQTICAIYNTAPSPTSLSYPYNGNIYQQTTFMEGGINVNHHLSGITGDNIPCFSKILAMTRTSTSTTATLKDFGLGNFELCHTDAMISCDASTVSIIRQQQSDGTFKDVFKYEWTLTIDQSGVGTIYDVIIQIPNGFNTDTSAITSIDKITGNTPFVETYSFISQSSSIILPDIKIKYCFFDNCEPQYQREVTAKSIPCDKPTPKPTKAPTLVPTSVPTASPVTTTMTMQSACTVSVSDEFCFNFSYSWTICNEGDRDMINIKVTSRNDPNYIYQLSKLVSGACHSETANYNPIRGSNYDPVDNDFEWTDVLTATAEMIIGGIKTITTGTTSSFNCNLCL